MQMFQLDPRLQADSEAIGDLPLSQVRLVNNADFPWVLLIPRQNDLREIHQLSPSDQGQLMAESSHLSKAMAAAFSADKMNVAALGNMVAQLHLHVIVRWAGDICWPGPIWGQHQAAPMSADQQAERQQIIAHIIHDWR
jgi:diadenosine tetraphosphate (Ap4A) HIT family hydrolase